MDFNISYILNFYVFILLFPGLIITITYRYATTNKMYPTSMFLMYSAIFSLINIVCAGIIINFIYDINLLSVICRTLINGNNENNILSQLDLPNNLTLEKIVNIIYLTTIPLAITVLLFINIIFKNQIIINIFTRYRIFTRAEISIWDAFIIDNHWLLIRDFDNGYAYYGYARYYSEGDAPKEIYLRKVSVKSNDTLTDLYEMESVFLSLENKNYVIESQEIDLKNQINRKLEKFYLKNPKKQMQPIKIILKK